MFKIDVHIHMHEDENVTTLLRVLNSKLDKIIVTQGVLMSKADELLAELVTANETTNEIAADLNDLIARVGEGSLSPTEAEAVKAKIVELKDRLVGVAAQYTPPAT